MEIVIAIIAIIKQIIAMALVVVVVEVEVVVI